MGQKRPIETDLPAPDYEAFLAMAGAAGVPPEELARQMIREGLARLQVAKTAGVVIPLPSDKRGEGHG